jgi:glutathione S-transferase
MKLHWSPKSPFVRKVMVCVHELGLQDHITLQRSVAAMTVPNPAIMADNPLSKIPTLVLDDGSALFDSSVICEYLDTLAGSRLFPHAPDRRWPALRWHAFGDGLLELLVLWRNEREREQPLQALVDAFRIKLAASLQRLEQEVPQLEAAPFCIGHIGIGCALSYLDYRFAEQEWHVQAPALAHWYATLAQRPSFVATEPVDG